MENAFHILLSPSDSPSINLKVSIELLVTEIYMHDPINGRYLNVTDNRNLTALFTKLLINNPDVDTRNSTANDNAHFISIPQY